MMGPYNHFKTTDDIVSFLTSFADKLTSEGKLASAPPEDIEDILKAGGQKQAKGLNKTAVDSKRTAEVNAVYNKYKDTWNKKVWRSGKQVNENAPGTQTGADQALIELNINGLINSWITRNNADALPGFNAIKDDIVPEVLVNVMDEIRNYDGTGTFAGYINQRIKWRFLDQFNKKGLFKKGFEETLDTPESRQIADKTPEKEFDEISDLSPKDRISKIRQIIKLAAKQLNLVRRSVIRALRTAPKVNKSVKNNPKAFEKYLREFYKLQLFKLMKNHLGIRKEYKAFIEKKAFDLVRYYIPLSSVVASKMDFLYEAVIDPKTGKQARMTTEEANKAGIPLEKDGSGPPKWKWRKVTPELRKDFVDWAFMRGEKLGIGINPETNKPYTRNTLGNRKDILSTFLAEEVGFDATMEVAQNPEQKQYDKEGNEILDEKGKPVTINVLERLGMTNEEISSQQLIANISDKIKRDPRIKLSKGLVSQNKMKLFYDKSGEFMDKGNADPTNTKQHFLDIYKGIFKDEETVANQVQKIVDNFLNNE